MFVLGCLGLIWALIRLNLLSGDVGPKSMVPTLFFICNLLQASKRHVHLMSKDICILKLFRIFFLFLYFIYFFIILTWYDSLIKRNHEFKPPFDNLSIYSSFTN